MLLVACSINAVTESTSDYYCNAHDVDAYADVAITNMHVCRDYSNVWKYPNSVRVTLVQ